MTEDTYTGSQYDPQSLNRYAYAMNNLVNMWDPTGNAPDWVGESTHSIWYESGPDNGHLAYEYILQNYWTGNGGIEDRGKETLQKEIIYHYARTVYQTWVYSYTHCSNYRIVTEFTEGPCPTPIEVERCDTETGSETYTDSFYDPITVRIPASDVSKQNQQEISSLIREMVGSIPVNSDGPVKWDISTSLIQNENSYDWHKHELSIVDVTVKGILGNKSKQDNLIINLTQGDIRFLYKNDFINNIPIDQKAAVLLLIKNNGKVTAQELIDLGITYEKEYKGLFKGLKKMFDPSSPENLSGLLTASYRLNQHGISFRELELMEREKRDAEIKGLMFLMALQVATSSGGVGSSTVINNSALTKETSGSYLTEANQKNLGIPALKGTPETIQVPGRVQSRINISNDGWEHVTTEHFSAKNKSQFTISQDELKSLLQSKDIVQTPVTRTLDSADGIRYVREIDVGRNIGTDKFNNFQPTSTMTVLTDKYGNLVTVTPGVIK